MIHQTEIAATASFVNVNVQNNCGEGLCDFKTQYWNCKKCVPL